MFWNSVQKLVTVIMYSIVMIKNVVYIFPSFDFMFSYSNLYGLKLHAAFDIS